jgi:hypothetical protein
MSGKRIRNIDESSSLPSSGLAIGNPPAEHQGARGRQNERWTSLKLVPILARRLPRSTDSVEDRELPSPGMSAPKSVPNIDRRRQSNAVFPVAQML